MFVQTREEVSMKRSILGFIVGLAVWVLVASLLNRSLRFGLEGYAAAEPQMTFTHAMMAARLALGALASLAAGAVTRAVAPSSTRLLWALGAVLLAAFIPVHIQLWAKFPVWYHLVFLGTLVPLVALGGTFTRNRSRI
jgi:CDP-diglyceride synthetase